MTGSDRTIKCPYCSGTGVTWGPDLSPIHALEENANSHLGDQPASHPGSEYDWAVAHIRKLRKIASDALLVASVGTHPEGQDGEAGLVRSMGDAVGEAETPNPSPITPNGA